MSERVERKILEILGNPTESPYGNPIPGLEELGAGVSAPFSKGVINIVALVDASDGPVTAVIRRLGEPAQVEPNLLLQLKKAGVVPGAEATFSKAGSYIVISVVGFGEGLELPTELANHIFVTA